MAYDHMTAKLCEENDQLEERVRELEEALRPFAGVPVHFERRGYVSLKVHNTDVDRARRALEGGK